MMLKAGTIYTSGSKLHQRKILEIKNGVLTYKVINSHAAVVIGTIHDCFTKDFTNWATAIIAEG